MVAPAASYDQFPATSYNPGPQFANPRTSGSQMRLPPSSLDEYIAAVAGPVPNSSYEPSRHSNNYPHAMGASMGSHDQYAAGADNGFDVGALGIKQCYHCHTTTTPLWRRDPETHATLCNACGLYLQQRHSQRPQQLIDADHDGGEDGSDDESDGDGAPECNHCHTRQTSVWRRDKAGNQVCNACGVYQRLRGKDRPLSLKRNKIKPRTRSQT
ncbi:hypothetical protein C8R45DRAFT_1038192 [Mycena sanguinolenta]|nr:hypothetical protein C8R45DRAFT_1038192 [Mycena sanguinolenta]